MSPSVSKQQQRFMGMVHKQQQDPSSDASGKVKDVAKSMKPTDVKDFASTSTSGLPEKSTNESQYLEVISKYGEFGDVLKSSNQLRDLAEKLNNIVEYAEQLVMSEQDDWFDRKTIDRNMKEVRRYSQDFGKIAEEADRLKQRLTALYDDIGHHLGRYFEIASPTPMTEMEPVQDEEEDDIEASAESPQNPAFNMTTQEQINASIEEQISETDRMSTLSLPEGTAVKVFHIKENPAAPYRVVIENGGQVKYEKCMKFPEEVHGFVKNFVGKMHERHKFNLSDCKMF